MRDFRNYNVWQESHLLTLEVYQATKEFPKEELFGLTSQLRRAVSSIPTNFAEGCGSNSEKEFGRYLNIAIASCSEVEYLLLLTSDLKYLNPEIHQNLESKVIQIRKQIYQLRLKLNQ
ncbi:four helix bundle protein [Flavobacterium sp. 5]|uniref:four helix bundle protein n=1 Tax=Flavobacterium sp. 5 TaxID=2035199 RepID=UPI000C2BCB7B|nr:four helix bundle protein [Flavobacterium sp. 5]PKB17055.1 four helix bundle protein [Flavobacterium sp. 5]